METGSKVDLTEAPPVYSMIPKISVSRKKIIIASVTAVVLLVIAIAAILIGVHMTQKHTESIFQMALKNKDGKDTQETVTVNKKEGVATFSNRDSGNQSSTVVYDYTNEVICMKSSNKPCYVMKMDKDSVPSLDSVIEAMKNTKNASNDAAGGNDGGNQYTAQREPIADRSILGSTINVLCSNTPIYWIQESSTPAMNRASSYRYCGYYCYNRYCYYYYYYYYYYCYRYYCCKYIFY
ncbi:pulmonary surfactant-associated protein C-like [Latimeria chalumnae]|uniref:pulmonary surfactant-associated protein C-like n=1 Tax=Latimeria chalumnae TaxID=7897 RepID=UPI00313B7444